MESELNIGGLLAGFSCAVLLYCFFELSSAALLKSRSGRLRECVKALVPGARKAESILEQGDRFGTVARVGSLLSAAAAGFFAADMARAAPDSTLARVILGDILAFEIARRGLSICVLFAAVLLVMLLLHFFKSVSLGNPERALSILSLPLTVSCKVLIPFVLIIDAFERLLARAGFKAPEEKEAVVSAEELSEIIEMSSEAGEIDDPEAEMIQGVFDISDRIVREVMTPRKDVVSVQIDSTLPAVVQIIRTSRVSRILVTGAELDDIRGVLLVKDLMRFVGVRPEKFSMSALMHPPYCVPNTKQITVLLQEMRLEGVHLAVVLDEHGGVDGIVTMEDLLEEIFGEIYDEFDRPGREANVRKTRSGDLIVNGGTLVRELNDSFGFNLPLGDYDTVAGFVIDRLGRIPDHGEVVDWEGAVLKVVDVSDNRIAKIKISYRHAPVEVVSKEELNGGHDLPGADSPGRSGEPVSMTRARIQGS